MQVPSTNPPKLSQDLQDDLTTALLSSGAIPRISQSMTHELQLAGWTTNLREYVQQLLRSGECTTYNEIMARVLAEVRSSPNTNGPTSNGINGKKKTAHGIAATNSATNGNSDSMAGKSGEDYGVRVSENAVKEGIKAVRKELETICELPPDSA